MARKGSAGPNRLRFAALFISNGRNGTRAYMALYPRSSARAAAVRAALWVKLPEVIAEIKRLTDQAYKAEQLSADETLARMARIASVDPLDLVWRRGELDSQGQPTLMGSIKPLEEMPEKLRVCLKKLSFDALGRPEFEFWSKDNQLTNLAKHHKLLNETTDVNINIGFADRLREAREKRLKGMK